MNTSILATIQSTETFLDALRKLASEAAAQPFRFSGAGLQTSLLQFFPPVGVKEGDDSRELAKPFARLLGGRWTVDGDTWRSERVEFPGLSGTKVIIHYVMPSVKSLTEVDLSSEPGVETSDYGINAPSNSVDCRP
jgi:hypothetical protein